MRLFRFTPRRVLFILAAAAAAPAVKASSKVEFVFPVPVSADPYADEVRGTVERPDGSVITVPAFFLHAGDDGARFAVRVFGRDPGTYRLVGVERREAGDWRPLAFGAESDRERWVDAAARRRFVRVDPEHPRSFAFEGGGAYVPIGGNLAWQPPGTDPVPYYRKRFAAFAAGGLNWTRIWMAHWAGLNLDWLPGEATRRQPEPGTVDPGVAERWDAILEAAEQAGVYVQVVLQHHGPYSSRVNSNWAEHPWNVANGGFLEKPGDFFTSPRAREITKRKYRYIVARWGWCPAVLAWELFNEVHWTDPLYIDHDESAVAAWHAEMAEWIRSLDTHGHMVTTSMDRVDSPVCAPMDYLQPHLYVPDAIAGARVIEPEVLASRRPVFFGEFGDDQARLSEAQKRAGVGLVPPVWSGLMGMLHLPAQQWYVDRLVESGRLGELAAVARFLDATGLAEREDLEPFSPAVASEQRLPFVLRPAFTWERRGDPAVMIPLDGSQPLELGNLAGIFVGDEAGRRIGFPAAMKLVVDLDRTEPVRIYFGATGAKGATAEVLVDSQGVARRSWAGEAADAGPVVVELAPGRHELELRNTGEPDDWFALERIELPERTLPALAAVGRRGRDFMALWLWSREGVSAVDDGEPVSGAVVVADVPAGRWHLQWWDSVRGRIVEETSIVHAGGSLRLEVAPFVRHRAVVLRREG